MPGKKSPGTGSRTPKVDDRSSIAVKVVARDDPDREPDELETVAALVAAVINREGVAGKVLDKFVSSLAALPEALSPATGLLALSIRNGLRLLDALPRLRRPRKTVEPAANDSPRRQVEKIRIG